MDKPIGADRKRVAVDLGTALGSEFTRLRTERGWSQSKFGELVGYDERYIRQLERGTKSPTLRTLSNIAAAFGIPVSALVRRTEKRIPSPSHEL
jgi:transcriptional regulator with XRE-family HTH domain